MKKNIMVLFTVLIVQLSFGQIVINELDSDTPSTDLEEFVELKSDTPNFPLDGYVIVFFNGEITGLGIKSYFAVDLDGYETDINGLLLIGSNTVSPVPQYLISANVIQNGADAVAIYQGSWDDFPNGTLATIDNLVDVLIYGTSDADATSLIDVFNDDPNFVSIQQIDEDENGNKDNESIQRNNDGTYFVGAPTPRQLNDGSGVILNGVRIDVPETQYNEGDSFDITITTEQNVDADLNFDISLNNETFDTSDFTGTTTLTIPTGQNTITNTIAIIDDSNDEGDEVMNIGFVSLPTGYLKLNNNIQIRVVDNDYTVAPWGTPKNPTYGMVNSTQPANYYGSLEGLSGANLRQGLQDIIADPNSVRVQTYADVYEILKEADQNPENSNEVWLVYTEQGRSKLDVQTGSSSIGKWQREHTFPQNRAGYYTIKDDGYNDGKDVYWTASADSLRHGVSDAHGIRAVDGPENASRGDKFYGEYTGPSGNSGSFKGDVARCVFYLAVRYNGLQIVNGYPEGIVGEFGDLATLLEWHRNDPPDDYEMNRNNVVYTWQHNRNPFIDQPDLAEYLWGSHTGELWSQSLSTNKTDLAQVRIFPNPAKNGFYMKGIKTETHVELYTADGRQIKSFKTNQDTFIDDNLTSGLYLLKLVSEGRSTVKKIIVE